MEEKEHIKISFSTALLIIALIVLFIMGVIILILSQQRKNNNEDINVASDNSNSILKQNLIYSSNTTNEINNDKSNDTNDIAVTNNTVKNEITENTSSENSYNTVENTTLNNTTNEIRENTSSENNNNNTAKNTTLNNTTNEIRTNTSSESNKNTTNNTNEKINNYATTMSWTEYSAPGIKFQYPSIFQLNEIGGSKRGNNQGEVSTIISGVAVGIDPDTKEKVESNVEIRVYEPFFTNEDVSKYIYSSNGLEKSGFTTKSGLRWYLDINAEKGKTYTEIYTHIEELNDGNKAIFKLEFEREDKSNYKVINIINYFLGSTKIINY